MSYLDHNATTPVDESVLEVMLPYMRQHFGNASAVHVQGRIARDAIEQARQQVADLVGAHPAQIVFTSGGTEANNLAIKGVVAAQQPAVIACSTIEHPSVFDVMKHIAQKQLLRWDHLAVTPDGVIDFENISNSANTNDHGLVSVMLANNETGAINDVARLRSVFPKALIHTDAVQAAGKIAVDFNVLDVDLLTLSAHKIYGPKGAGAMVMRKSVLLEPQLHGGGQEKGWRSGTENVAAIAGFGHAAVLARIQLQQRQQHVLLLRSQLEKELRQMPGVVIFAETIERLPNTVFFAQPWIEGETLLMLLDQQGFAVGSGSACASQAKRSSPVLRAMQVNDTLAANAIRVSLGASNTEAEVHEFCTLLKNCLNMSGLSVLNPA